MGYLPPEVIPVKFGGLRTDQDSKGAPLGVCELLENTQSTRMTEGGVQIEKRPGTPSLSTTKLGGGNVSSGSKVAALGSELVMTDGHRLYSRASTLAQWIEKGKVCDLDAVVKRLPGGTTTGAFTRLDCDVAYADGYAFFVASTDSAGPANWYVLEVATDTFVASGGVGGSSSNARVLALANAFFLFVWDGTNTLKAYKIPTSAPTTLGSATNVATNLHTAGVFDVIADVTNTRFVVGYRNTTPTTTLMIWNTNQTAGTTVAYATRDPDKCIGFLDWTFADGNGYVGIGTSATGVRVLTFGSSSMTVGTDTQVDGAETDARAVTGYFSTVRNVFYTRPHATLTYNDRIGGWSNGSAFTVMRSITLASRAFSMAGKRYVMAAYDSTAVSQGQSSLFLLELETDATGPSQVTVAGFLVNGNAARRARNYRSIGAIAVVSATAAIGAVTLHDFITPTGAGTGHDRYAPSRISLDWSGTKTGAPVQFNGMLYFPGACPKVYDGAVVAEPGFMLFPEKPVLTASNGGSLTLLATYEYCLIYSKIYPSGRIEQSAPSDVASITLTGIQQTVAVAIPSLRVTDADSTINPNPLAPTIRVDTYRRKAGGVFRLRSSDAAGASNDGFSLNDNLDLGIFDADEEPYSDNEVDHSWPPAVRAYCVHRNRLFAISGDGSVWFTKESTEGNGTSFSDSFRILFDPADGDLVGLISLDATLVACKRNTLWGIIGEGPTLDGNNPYVFPAPLPAVAGLTGPRPFASTPDGALILTAKGFHMLDRAGGLQPMPGADAYDTLTGTGGVALDDRTMAVIVTSDGRSLCWDWQLKVWHSWTGMPAVSCCRWQNKFTWLESNGKVHVETPGAFSDDAGAYTMSVKLSWLDLIRAYTRGLQVVGEAQASCTLQALITYNFDTGNADPTRSLALTTGGPKAPWVLEPNQGYLESLQLLLTETSTTAGVKLTKALLELSRMAGMDKYAGSNYFT